MRRMVFAALAVVALSRPAGAQTRSLEILSFDADYGVNQSGHVHVQERITARFHGSWNGLYRVIPIRYHMDNGTDYTIALNFVSVKDERGNSLQTEIERDGAHLKLKAWIPGAVDTTHTLLLDYTVDNALRFFDEHDELYWNVTGNAWEYPIQSVTARVFLPKTATGQRSTVFTGVTGSRNSNAEVVQEGNVAVFRSTVPLGLHEGLTLVHGWDQGVVARPTWIGKALHAVRSNAVLLFPVIALLIMLWLWRRFGRDPSLGVIVPRYAPPEGMTPAEAGILMDLTVDNRDIAATMVDLAVRGHIRIREVEKKELFGLFKSRDYRIERVTQRGVWTGLRTHERKMLEGLFAKHEDEVELSELENVFYTTLAEMKKSLTSSLTDSGFYRNNPFTVRGVFLFGAVVTGMIVMAVGNYFATSFGISQTLVTLSALLTGIVVMVVGWSMPARTVRGTQAVRDLLGFEEFLGRVEGDRMQRVIDSPDLFEKYLPFAMAFRVDRQWAAAFDGICTTPPQWYSGSNTGLFRTSAFINDLGHMTTSASTAMASAPRSSGGSGFSGGGGGGGSSGGGFGGGGGGGF